MVTKLICQLPDVNAFGRKGRLSFDPERVKDLGCVPDDWNYKFNPSHVKDAEAVQKKSHPMELQSRSRQGH